MASTINASSSSTTGIITTADSSGIIQLQSNGTAVLTGNTSGALGVGSSPSYGTSGQALVSAGSDAAPSWTTLNYLALSGGALTGGLREAKVAIAASDIDCTTGNYFTKTISGTTTLTVSNVPTTGTVAAFVLDLTNGGSATVNWWSGMKWASGTAPTLTASGRDALGFFTHDGGTTWTGLVLGKDIK